MLSSHSLKVITNDKGECILEQQNELIRTSCKCMSRLSVAFAANDDVKERLTNILITYMLLLRLIQFKNINTNANTALHIDHRDIDAVGKLLGKWAYTKSGMKSSACNKK